MTWRVGSLVFSASSLPITGLLLWLKGDAISGVSDGAALTTWVDSSGAGFDVSQSTSGDKPTYRASVAAFGNMPAVEFDGSTDYLSRSATLTSVQTDWSIFAVLKPSSTSDTQVPVMVGGDDRGWGIATSTDTSKKGWIAGGVAWNSSTVAADTTAEVWCVTNGETSPGETALYLDGVQQTTWGTLPGVPRANTTIGQSGDGSFGAVHQYAGQIAEVLIYQPHLSATDRAFVEAYLAGKYGL